MQKIVKWVVKNWDKIPDKYKTYLRDSEYSQNIKDLKLEEHFVVLLLDRQKPTVEKNYDFHEERIGITKTGKIIWGFDSGCSCPSPWHDNYPDCYSVSKKWKEFEVESKNFDVGWLEEITKKVEEIKKCINSQKK